MNDFALRESDGVFDFVVDGMSLQAALRTVDTSTLRGWDQPQALARELLDAGVSLEGRVPIYACRDCQVRLDTWDGGYAVRVTRMGERIVWGEIEGFTHSVGDSGERLDFTPTGVGPFEFDLAQYESALAPRCHPERSEA